MWEMYRKMKRMSGLRLAVLHTLSESPKNGVEIMEEAEKRSMGWWKPSPGSIYPVLNSLAEETFIRKMDDGRYEITAIGIKEINSFGFPINQKPYNVDGVISEIENYLSYLEDTQKAKLAPYSGKIHSIKERLQKLEEETMRHVYDRN
jgi:DNA-binding PadR family transcriptional regulator